jgi:hypothetical protein
MINNKLVLLAFILFLPISHISGQGLEIYLVNHDYPDFKKEYTDEHCYYCFEPQKCNLYDTSLIKQSDIINFNWEKQSITLSDEGLHKIKNLTIPLQGLAAAFTIDGEPIYGFWLWNILSSFGCDRVFALIYPDTSETLKIGFGLSKKFAEGDDPRFDERLKQYLTTQGLIK